MNLIESEIKCVWHKGVPSKCYGTEWFIACLDNGDRVVLRSLPEEFSYDYTTADDTYYRKDRIAKWMQFPDSHFVNYEEKSSYTELIMAVARKFPNETRHQTALRYIKQAEQNSVSLDCKQSNP